MAALVATAVASTAAFAALALAVAVGATRDLDLATTLALQRSAGPLPDLVANLNTVLGQPAVSGAVALALALALRGRAPGASWLAPLLIALTVAAGVALKSVLEHPSPPPEFVRAWWNPLGVRVETPSAFPSGHIARVTFLAALVAGVWTHVWVRTLAAGVAAVTFVARIYIGDHWLSDALGGLLLGIAIAAVALAWVELSRGRPASA